MLEKPDLQDERIIACLQDDYGLRVAQIAFLPLGADLNAAVYRVVADDDAVYFLKLKQGVFDEPVAVKLAALLKARRDEILDLVGRAEGLAQALWARSLECIVCHSDLHAGNILLAANGAFYIVDWDEPILAPKERDLMFVGGGQMANRRTPQEEETLFYRGYGQTQVDPAALAYYRYERIIQDIAVYCEQIFLTDKGGQDREQSFQYLTSNFLPNDVLEIASQTRQWEMGCAKTR